jgi:hypothetical protein
MSKRTAIAIKREIASTWEDICHAAGTRPEAVQCLPNAENIRILGSGYKTDLAEFLHGVFTAVVYMSPDNEAFPDGSRRTMCPRAGLCSAACLGHNTGRLAMAPGKRSRLWKTTLFLGARALYDELIGLEIEAHERKAVGLNMIPAVRLDGSTDTGHGMVLAERFSHSTVQFYDYTKVLARLARSVKHKNYDLTYSLSEKHKGPLPEGFNVAGVFATRKGEAFPDTYMGREVISGDEHDARFLDPPNKFVALSFKAAKARDEHLADAMGFVRTDAGLAPQEATQ